MKMKSYATFALWAAAQTPKKRRLISSLRKLVKKTAPSLTESVKWGNGVWIGEEYPVLFIFAGATDHLQFGFFGGSSLKDPGGLLVGDGKYIRHIKVRTPKDISSPALVRWIKEARKLERE